MTDTPRTAVEARLFALVRHEDVSGTSGTGVVAEGVVFSDGRCALRWLTATASTAVYDSLADLEAIHSHDGRTEVHWRLTNEAANERLRAAVRAWVDYWDARTELWDAVGKCGHDPTADCPEMDAIRAQGTDDKYDHELRAALAATPAQSNPELARLYADIEDAGADE